MTKLILQHFLLSLGFLLLAGFFGTLLVRQGPGFGLDEESVDIRRSNETRKAIQREREAENRILPFYGRYLWHAVHGDWGTSTSFHMPVGSLIQARAGVTFRLITLGLAIGWFIGLSLAFLSLHHFPAFSVWTESVSGVFFSLPAAVLALIMFLAGGPVPLVIGFTSFPQIYRHARDLFARAFATPQVTAAQTRGIAAHWIFLRYVARPAWAPLVALAGVGVTTAFGAAIPVEVVCDLPGLGQLAWKAALGRDLPLLVSLTLIVAAITLFANTLAEIALSASRR